MQNFGLGLAVQCDVFYAKLLVAFKADYVRTARQHVTHIRLPGSEVIPCRTITPNSHGHVPLAFIVHSY